MIYTGRTITVGGQESIIDKSILLYRGDRDVLIEFTLVGDDYSFADEGNIIKSTNASHGQLVLNTPSGKNMFTDVTKCEEGKVKFLITYDMIDELDEVGFYSFQIRLFDETQQSRVSIPPVMNGFELRRPIAAEDENNLAGLAYVDYSIIQNEEEVEEIFNEFEQYIRTGWKLRDVITTGKLNKIENALYEIHENAKRIESEAKDRDNENKTELDSTIHQTKNELDLKIDSVDNRLDSKIDSVDDRLDSKIDSVDDRLDSKIDSTKAELQQKDRDLDNDISSINTTLRTKADVSFVNNKVFNMSNMGQDIKEAMTGGSVPVVGTNAILTENILDGQVTYAKTSFFKQGKNLFDKNATSPNNWFMNQTNGKPEQNQYTGTYCYSDYIKVRPGSTIHTNGYLQAYVEFDASKKYIKGTSVTSSNTTYTVSDNCEYVVVNMNHTDRNILQIEYGDTTTEYEPFGYSIENLDLNVKYKNVESDINDINEEINTIKEDLDDKESAISNINDVVESLGIKKSKNLFNKNSVIGPGVYINQTNGKPLSNEYTKDLCYSKIFIDPSKGNLAINRTIHSYVFMDVDDNYISGNTTHNIPGAFTLEIPDNAHYIYVSPYYSYGIADLQVEYGTESTTYEPFLLELSNARYGIDIEKVNDRVDNVDNRIAVLDENLTFDTIELEYGKMTTPRNASSTFTGWGVPIKKSSLNEERYTHFEISLIAYDNSTDGNVIYDVPFVIEVIKGKTATEDGWRLDFIRKIGYGTLKEPGLLKCSIDLDVTDLDDNFIIGARALTKCNVMTYNAIKNDGFSYDNDMLCAYSTEYSQSTTGWSKSTSLSYAQTEWRLCSGKAIIPGKHTHTADEIIGLNVKESKVKLSLPDKYELVVGDTFELFYKGILLCNNPYNYNFVISCSKGAYYSKKYMFTPTASDVGTHNLTITILDDDENTLDSKQVKLIVKNKAKSPASKCNVLCVGDSLTSGGAWPSEVHRRLTGSNGTPVGEKLTNINFIGSKQTSSGCKYEGYGGWTYGSYNTNSVSLQQYWLNTSGNRNNSYQKSVWKDSNNIQWVIETIEYGRIKVYRNVHGTQMLPASGTLTWVSGGDGTNNSDIVYTSYEVESGNPFWDNEANQVDFGKYATRMGVDSIDHCYILLGWNQTGTTEQAFKNDIQLFVDNIRKSFPNCSVTLMGLQVASLDGFGTNYGCSWNYYDKFKVVFNMNKWNYEAAKANQNMDFINIAGQFDTENNMPKATRQVNVRNQTTEKYGSNGVHPDSTGYMQIADAVYRHLTHKLQ